MEPRAGHIAISLSLDLHIYTMAVSTALTVKMIRDNVFEALRTVLGTREWLINCTE